MNTRTKQMVAVAVAVVAVVVVVIAILGMQGALGDWFPGGAVTIKGCTLKGGASCPKWNLSGQNLNNVNISRGNFAGTDFSNSSVANVNVSSTDFTGAKFINGSLNGSTSGAIFTNANSCNAILTTLPDALPNTTGEVLQYSSGTSHSTLPQERSGLHLPVSHTRAVLKKTFEVWTTSKVFFVTRFPKVRREPNFQIPTVATMPSRPTNSPGM